MFLNALSFVFQNNIIRVLAFLYELGTKNYRNERVIQAFYFLHFFFLSLSKSIIIFYGNISAKNCT